MSESANAKNKAHQEAHNLERKFVVLGVLLQALHVLFGVTAVLGMYLTLGRIQSMNNDLWREHCRWQLTTVWLGAVLYILALTIGLWLGHWLPFILAVMWVSYRILCSALGVFLEQPIRHWYK